MIVRKTFIPVEIWKPVKGYEGLYDVSDWGRVRNASKKVLRHHYDYKGYSRLNLVDSNGLKSTKAVHRLVATAFIDNPYNKPEVNHKKGMKWDNRASMLEWVTRQENAKHAKTIPVALVKINLQNTGLRFDRGWSCKRSKHIICESIETKIRFFFC